MRFKSTFIVFFIFMGLTEKARSFDWERKIQFAKAFDCKARMYSPQRCAVSAPKDFTATEEKEILLILNRLPKSAIAFFQGLLPDSNDRLIFYRHQHAYEMSGPRHFKRNDDSFAWVDLALPNTVHVTDKFFASQGSINEKYSYKEYLLFHELSHIYDANQGSISKQLEFLDLYGWHEADTGETQFTFFGEVPVTRWQTQKMTYSEVDALRARVIELARNGDYRAAESLSLGTSRSLGFPTSYSMTNPQENFAELVTHHFLDPGSMQTVPVPVRDWLDKEFK